MGCELNDYWSILINFSFELINGATGIVNEMIHDDDK